jgi:hypothetical protein
MTAIKHGFGSALAYIDANLVLLTPPQIVIANDSETRYITQIYTSFTVLNSVGNAHYALLRVRLTRNIENQAIIYLPPTQFEQVRPEDDTIFLSVVKGDDYSFGLFSAPHHVYHFSPPLTIPQGKTALVSLNHYTDVNTLNQQILAYVSVHGYTQQDKIQELQELR